MATGTARRNAIRPDHLCRPPIHGGAVTRGTLPSLAVPVARSSTGAWVADGAAAPGSDSTAPTCVPSGNTIHPALIVAPRTTAVARYRPDGFCTAGTENRYMVPWVTISPVYFP